MFGQSNMERRPIQLIYESEQPRSSSFNRKSIPFRNKDNMEARSGGRTNERLSTRGCAIRRNASNPPNPPHASPPPPNSDKAERQKAKKCKQLHAGRNRRKRYG